MSKLGQAALLGPTFGCRGGPALRRADSGAEAHGVL